MCCWSPARAMKPGQIVGKTVLPFSDHDAVAAAVRGEDYHG